MGVLQLPAKGRVTQGYSLSHRALDFGWGNGTIVYAAAAGTIGYDWTPGYGNRLTINHGSLIQANTVTRYAHLASMKVKSGKVVKGQPIAVMGETGSYPTAVHLHFELLVGTGVRLAKIDPSSYFLDQSGGGTTPIPPKKATNMPVIVQNTSTQQTALVDTKTFEVLSASRLTVERRMWGGNYLQVSPAEWALISAPRDTNPPIQEGAFTSADRAMLDDIASKGELTQALTSTVQAVNNQAAVNKQEILNAIDEIDAGAPQNLQVTLSGTAAAV